MSALTLLSSTFSLYLLTSGESETARQQRYFCNPGCLEQPLVEAVGTTSLQHCK